MCIYDCMWNPTVRLLLNRFLSYLIHIVGYTCSADYPGKSGTPVVKYQDTCHSRMTSKINGGTLG